MDFFEEVAKYRATRAVWTQLVRERFGGTTERAQHFRLHAATSGRPLTAQQPLNNISRITLQILAQILGGCEQTRTASFDEALGIPTEVAARTSIRANQVIAYETGVPYTVDPLGGSYYVESLTHEFRRAHLGGDREGRRDGRRARGHEAGLLPAASSPRAPTATRSQIDAGEQGDRRRQPLPGRRGGADAGRSSSTRRRSSARSRGSARRAPSRDEAAVPGGARPAARRCAPPTTT